MPCFLPALYSSTAPFITPWSVSPSAGWPKLRARAGERLDLARAVEQRVLGVDVEVGAAGRRHGLTTLRTDSDAIGLTTRIVRD